MISLKGHPVVAFELPARGGWINRQRRQFLVRKPSSRSALDFGTEALNQFRRTFTWFHRVATQTGTISTLQRFARTREEIDILSRRLFGRACGPAENSRRAHSNKEYAFETRIAIHERAIHCFWRRKKIQCFHVQRLRARMRSRIDEIQAANSKRSASVLACDRSPWQTKGMPYSIHARWIRKV